MLNILQLKKTALKYISFISKYLFKSDSSIKSINEMS